MNARARLALTLIVFLFPFPALLWAASRLPVVVTLSFLKDFTENIGGPHVQVRSLMTGMESEHTYTPRPGDLVAIAEARLLVRVGLGLDAWVDALVRNAASDGLSVVTASDGISRIRESKASHDNVHLWLDPKRVQQMVRSIAEGLSRVDPSRQAVYKNNMKAYAERLDYLSETIAARTAVLKDRKIITHHAAWPYFADRFGFQIVGTIEANAGDDPTAKRIEHLISVMRKEGVRVIVSEPQLSQKVPQILAEETGAKVVILSPLPGGIPGTDSYIDLMHYNAVTLIKALSAS